MSADTETRILQTDAEPCAVMAILTHPRRIPEWAPAFADNVAGDDETGWRVVKDGRAFPIRLASDPASRTVRYLREVAPGHEGGATIQVLPGTSGGSAISLTVPIPRDGDPAAVAALLKEELTALARLALAESAAP
jgi:hypothetical protein